MYVQHIQEELPYLMLYTGVTVCCLIACCYLLFRRGNAIAPNVTSSTRLRRYAAAFLGVITLSYMWCMSVFYLTEAEAIRMVYLVGALFDFLTVFPLAMAVMLTMLQDRRRPLWPIPVLMAPLVAGMAVCIATQRDDVPQALYAYYLLLTIGLIIYMVRTTRQYGRWLRDNFADLEHKEVWHSLVVLAIILLGFSLYPLEIYSLFFKYAVRVNTILLTCFLVWRVETLSDLSQGEVGGGECKPQPTETEDLQSQETGIESATEDKIRPLLQRHCIDTQLYLQHDLTVQQLAKAVGTNRYYLSQYFSRQGTTYNAYINELRIAHFTGLYREAVATRRHFTVRQLAQDSGYRNYTTFSNAFKQCMGMNVTAWIQNSE